MRTERDKYEAMWNRAEYRRNSPGERCLAQFLSLAGDVSGKTFGDFGCGTGRAALLLAKATAIGKITLVDIAHNSADPEAREFDKGMEFLVHDLSQPLALRVDFGYCCDVMEHVPRHQVDAVLSTIVRCAERTFFQIATFPDHCGKLIGEELHLTIEQGPWWRERLKDCGVSVEWLKFTSTHCLFYVTGVKT